MIGDPYPYWWNQWQYPTYQATYQPPPCDHCLCIDVELEYPRTRPHRECCHCRKLYLWEVQQDGSD